jgi:hypothetical protein
VVHLHVRFQLAFFIIFPGATQKWDSNVLQHQGKLEAMQICHTKMQSKIAMKRMQAKNAIHCKIPMQKTSCKNAIHCKNAI